MSKRGALELLFDVLESIQRIESYSRDMNLEKLMDSLMVQDAIVRNLEIIGEAVKNIPDGIKTRYDKTEWKEISGMRDKLIHFYFGVNWDIVWETIKEKLPIFKRQIEEIVKELEHNSPGLH